MSASCEKGSEAVFRHEFFETTSVTDFLIHDAGPPPAGYPEASVPDDYSKFPFSEDYAARCEALLEHCLRNPAGETIKGYYYELARLYKGRGPVHEGMIRGALRYIDRRFDCADFVLLGIIRLLYQFRESELLSPGLVNMAERTVLNFKYWPDEPGIDSMCYWTENHQIMFAANDYLAGLLFPDSVFTNSKLTGREKAARACRRIKRWLELRFKTGFSEWLSHIYYDEDITALVNLVDFSPDPELTGGAEIVLDLIFLDMALNSHYGIFGSTHGRSYTREKKSALFESTADTAKLLFGMGVFAAADNMSAVTLAVSGKYRLPEVLYSVAADSGRPEMINRQRMGIRIKDARRWGLGFRDLEDGMVFLSLEAYTHPRTIGLVMKMFGAYRWWENQFFTMFKAKRHLIGALRFAGLLGAFARVFEKDITRNTREEVNIYTYKTPDYMLSAAQDYRKGYGGDQQHIWQATLSPEAVCFTTHPGKREDTSPGYWVGSGSLPRVAQLKNVLIAVYNISGGPGIYLTNRLFFTHAWFPKAKFDQVEEKDGWIFGRKGDGYIALYSRRGYRRPEQGEEKEGEVIAGGRRNIWLCEMGRRETDGSFAHFTARILGARLVFKGQRVYYESPSQGPLEFGWRGPFRHRGCTVPLDGYPRYGNPYCSAPFPPEEVVVAHHGRSLRLDLARGLREIRD